MRKPSFSLVYDTSRREALVLLDEYTQVRLFHENNQVAKLLTFRVNSAAGLSYFLDFRLPESFDPAISEFFYKQGRGVKSGVPNFSYYSVEKFSARKFSLAKSKQLLCDDRFQTIRWIDARGEFFSQDQAYFSINHINVGDTIQIYYESTFEFLSNNNLFYFYSWYPKINVEYLFSYRVPKENVHFNFLLGLNMTDSCFNRKKTAQDDYVLFNDQIKLTRQEAINYPANCQEGNNLPHVFFDKAFYGLPIRVMHDLDKRVYGNAYTKPINFEWLVVSDTTTDKINRCDQEYLSVQKFVAQLPPLKQDSLMTFFSALCDTINQFRYITWNHLYYNESHLYKLKLMDHVAKRRLVGSSFALYHSILDNNGIFYYLANIEDRRYGEHSSSYRVHKNYESTFYAIPNKGSFFYFMARRGGVPYYLNELPFYFEGVLAALLPYNFQASDSSKAEKAFKFIKTHRGTFNENTRTENARVVISLDGKKMAYSSKVSLSGQFSTLLRHLYLGEYIDSTVSAHYFKLCTDKPGSYEKTVRLSSKLKDFPFRHTFNCSSKVNLDSSNKLQLTGWFSFTLNSKILSQKPTHEYFFDFDHSDLYNFMLDFGSAVSIKNAESFNKKINNPYFELDSEIQKNSESTYLLKVKVLVKKNSIPLADMQLLMDLVKELDTLNNFTLDLEKKS